MADCSSALEVVPAAAQGAATVRLPLRDLEKSMCHWPTNNPGRGDGDRMLFCAEECAPGDHYCPTHRALSGDGRSVAKRKADTDRAAKMRAGKRPGQPYIAGAY
jgi:hypothetical protein